jgi:hypothetical protein
MASAKEVVCKVCKIVVADKDKAVACDACMEWRHIKCVSISVEKYKFLQDEHISWYCAECKGAAKALRNQMIDMKKQMDKMQERMDIMEKNQVTEAKVVSIVDQRIQDDFQERIKDVVKEQVEEAVKTAAAEKPVTDLQLRDAMHDLMIDVEVGEKKQENLIIYRLEEPQQDGGSDSEEVNKILKHINKDVVDEDVKMVKRIGQKEDGKTRPVLVKMKDVETAKHILKNTKKLKRSPWNISIEVDRTKRAREYVKHIRQRAIEEKGDEAHDFLFKIVGDPGRERVVTIRKKKEGEEEGEES